MDLPLTAGLGNLFRLANFDSASDKSACWLGTAELVVRIYSGCLLTFRCCDFGPMRKGRISHCTFVGTSCHVAPNCCDPTHTVCHLPRCTEHPRREVCLDTSPEFDSVVIALPGNLVLPCCQHCKSCECVVNENQFEWITTKHVPHTN